MNSFLNFYNSKISKEISRSIIAFLIGGGISLSVYLFESIPKERDEVWNQSNKLLVESNSYIQSLDEYLDHNDNSKKLMQNIANRMDKITPIVGIYCQNILPKDSIFFYKKILQQSLISNSSDHSLAKALILDTNKKEDVEFLNVLNSEKVMLKNMLEIISTNRSIREKDNEIYANFGENLYTWGNYISIVHGRDKKTFSEGQNNDQIYKILAANERLKIKRIIVISLIIFCFLSSLTLSLIAMRVGHL